MVHELLHAFDHCRFKVDYKDIRHLACGEVGLLVLSIRIEGQEERLMGDSSG